jgi:hypothetical protein
MGVGVPRAADMVGILHGTSYPYVGPARWFRRLSNNTPVTVVTEAACTGDLAEPLGVAGTACDDYVPYESAVQLSGGAIAGIVVAVVLVVGMLLAVGLTYLHRRRQAARTDKEAAPLTSM